MARNEKLGKDDDEMAHSMTNSGSTTRMTDNNEDEQPGRERGMFG